MIGLPREPNRDTFRVRMAQAEPEFEETHRGDIR